MYWYFIFFFVSGFCSILYEVVWLRLAMAQFGVTTALVSIVLSAFSEPGYLKQIPQRLLGWAGPS
jgi:hypothetical protein